METGPFPACQRRTDDGSLIPGDNGPNNHQSYL